MKNYKKSQNTSDIFWRKHMDVDVVDLRKIVKQKATQIEKTKHASKPKEKPRNKNIEVPEYFAALKRYRESKPKDTLPSREEILEELSQVVLADVPIQFHQPSNEYIDTTNSQLIPSKNAIFTDTNSYSKKQRKALKEQVLKNSYAYSTQLLSGRFPVTDQPGEISQHGKNSKKYLKKAFFYATSLLLVLSVPFITLRASNLKDEIGVRAEVAYGSMIEGKDALFTLNTAMAQEKFLHAQQEFEEIERSAGLLSEGLISLFAKFPVQSRLGSMAHLLRAGKFFSSAGYEAALALSFLQNTDNLTDNLIKASFNLEKSQISIKEASLELSYIRPEDIPKNFQDGVLAIQDQTSQIEDTFNEAFSSVDVLLTFLGHQSPKNYLVAFQNSSELRATGGFIGTYGLLKLDKGSVVDLFVDGIYNPDGQLSVNVVPPRPLQYVTSNWGTRDSNWFFDFPTSAQKTMWFYEQTGGIQTDGVIAITPRVIERLLVLSGPISMSEYDIVLSADNFLELVQEEVELNYDKKLNRPKQILTDFTPKLIEKLSQSDNKIAVLNIILGSLNNKDIQIYSKDSNVQNFVSDKNWMGEVAQTGNTEDYLAMVISNIGGWKTDKYTQTELDTVTTITGDGEILRTVLISRKHDGGYTPYAWYNKPNYGYIRIYTPSGSELVSAEGFSQEPNYVDIDYKKKGYLEDFLVSTTEINLRKDRKSGTDIFEESGKTVFGNWLSVPAGERKLVKITYKLPFRIADVTTQYGLTLQKQSGVDIKYSGAVEEFHHELSISACKFESDNSSFADSFEFTQTSDEKIICNLVR